MIIGDWCMVHGAWCKVRLFKCSIVQCSGFKVQGSIVRLFKCSFIQLFNVVQCSRFKVQGSRFQSHSAHHPSPILPSPFSPRPSLFALLPTPNSQLTSSSRNPPSNSSPDEDLQWQQPVWRVLQMILHRNRRWFLWL